MRQLSSPASPFPRAAALAALLLVLALGSAAEPLRSAPSSGSGSMDLGVVPADAAVRIDGAAASPGVAELPAGRHSIEVRRFGYIDKDADIDVREGESLRLQISLEKAPFAISGFGFSRKTFNPGSTDASATTDLMFRATSRGSARAEIHGPDGRTVARFDFPVIEDWDQSKQWNGLGNDGSPLPDGLYTAHIVAKGEGTEEPIEAEAQVQIYSSLFLVLPPDWVPSDTKTPQVPVPLGSQPPQMDPPDIRIQTLEVDNTLEAQTASIQVYCFSRNARTWIADVPSARICIDRSTTDYWVPYLGDLPEGSHYIEVRIPGYYPLGHWFMLSEKTLYTLQFTPTRITGTLNVSVEPKDASVLVDGTAAAPGLSELPVGKHRLEVRKFGYVGQSLDVTVRERKTDEVSVSLEKAGFAIEGLGFSRESFNPRSIGDSAKVDLRFRATAPCSARVEIRDADGVKVASLELPNIDYWNQRKTWDGLGSDGQPLPEGMYVAHLVATSPDSAAPIEAEARVWIDSSLVVRVFGPDSAVPGLLYMPDPVPPASGTVAIEGFFFAPLGSSWSSSSDGAFGLASGFSVAKNVELGLHASVELASENFGSGDLDGSILVGAFGDKTTAWSGAFFLRGGCSSLELPAMPGAGSLVEASFPLGARLGSIGEADARLAIAPGFRADFSSSAAYLAVGSAAFWLEGKKFRAGISGELPLSFTDGATIYRSADTALEARFLSGPFVVAAYATADFAPGESPAPGFGLGLGLLF